MDRPLTGSAEAEEELEWQVASRRRKAWAKCRSSWQASETEDLSTEATTQDEDEDEEEDLPGAQLPAAAGRGNVPNEKIAIWLKDCRSVWTGRSSRATRAASLWVPRPFEPADSFLL
ncbi:Protein itprid2 [Saguinus oedipus]|uniref:Protein itprid2 n=1 Tax=Saguinus oedipus TaxID=9490 RepID=A0ABQ9VH89_SAGOE|nr:Protein itprid2 [Saguinus oedipus]